MSVVFQKMKKEMSDEWRIYQKEELHIHTFSPNTIKIIKNEYNIEQPKDKEFR